MSSANVGSERKDSKLSLLLLDDEAVFCLNRIADALEKIVDLLYLQKGPVAPVSCEQKKKAEVVFVQEREEDPEKALLEGVEKNDVFPDGKAVFDLDPLYEFLERQGLKIVSFNNGEAILHDESGVLPDESEDPLDQVAKFIGERYGLVDIFLKGMKRSLNTGRVFNMLLKNYPPEQIGSICQLANNLYKLGILSLYVYQKSPKFYLTAAVTGHPNAINFVTGGWLERYIKNQTLKVLRSIENPKHFGLMTNVQLEFPDGDKGEVDIIGHVKGEVFLIECTSGEILFHVERTIARANSLGVGFGQCFVVASEIERSRAASLSKLYGVPILAVDDFGENLQRYVRFILKSKEKTSALYV